NNAAAAAPNENALEESVAINQQQRQATPSQLEQLAARAEARIRDIQANNLGQVPLNQQKQAAPLAQEPVTIQPRPIDGAALQPAVPEVPAVTPSVGTPDTLAPRNETPRPEIELNIPGDGSTRPQEAAAPQQQPPAQPAVSTAAFQVLQTP